MDIYRAALKRYIIHRYSPTPTRIIVYHIQPMFNSNSQIVALFSVIKSCSWVNFFLRMPSGGEYHLISRDWGTNQIAWKALFTCVVYTKLGYPLIARPRAVNCGMENGCGAPVPEFLTIRFCPDPSRPWLFVRLRSCDAPEFGTAAGCCWPTGPGA